MVQRQHCQDRLSHVIERHLQGNSNFRGGDVINCGNADLIDEEGEVVLLDVHEAQLRREHQRLAHCHLRAVDVVLLHIPAAPCPFSVRGLAASNVADLPPALRRCSLDEQFEVQRAYPQILAKVACTLG